LRDIKTGTEEYIKHLRRTETEERYMKSPTDFLKKEHFRDEYPDDFAAKQQNTVISEEKRKELETENRKELSESEKIRLEKKMMVEFKESLDKEHLEKIREEAEEIAKKEYPNAS
jgi:hypothetical protein